MNPLRLFLLFITLTTLSCFAVAQQVMQADSLGLPGDNLNLYAVLEVFQECPTLEEFEQKLNSEDLNINNLDLDGDGYIDFIQVEDNFFGNSHSIVLKVAISSTEWQDVAVIQVDRDANDRVLIQVIGDEALYGENYIIEPNYDQASATAESVTPNPGYVGTTSKTVLAPDGRTIVMYRTTTVEVARWPVIRYIYMEVDRPWFSPWYYSHYPSWWRPWRTQYWHYYWGYHYHHYHYYFGHYRRWHDYRNPDGHNRYFAKFRSRSHFVSERKRKGAFAETYSRPDLRKEGIAQYEKTRPAGMRSTARVPTREVEKRTPAATGVPPVIAPSVPRPERERTTTPRPTTRETERSTPPRSTTPPVTTPPTPRQERERTTTPRPTTRETERSTPPRSTIPPVTTPPTPRPERERTATPKPPTKEVEKSAPATTPPAEKTEREKQNPRR